MPLQRHAALLGRVACSDMRLWIAESGVLDGGARSASGAKTITQQHVSRWYSSATRVLGMPVVDVPVPSMGESITEGSVAAVLKQPGQAVAADDIILQIETDKVTIDVRAPQQGVMTSILVKEGDTITVGQRIAQVDTEADSRRQPAIQFPMRRTPQGVAISTMSAEERAQFLQPALSGSTAAKPPTPAAPGGASARATVTVAWDESHMSARRTLTEREMEMIMLGGAEP